MDNIPEYDNGQYWLMPDVERLVFLEARIKQSKVYLCHWETLELITEEYLRRDEPMPAILKQWVIDAVRGKKPGGRQPDHYFRDRAMCVYVRDRMSEGDSFRAATERAGSIFNKSPEAIRAVWSKRKGCWPFIIEPEKLYNELRR